MKHFIIVQLSLVLTLAGLPARGDIIRTKGGKTIEGLILDPIGRQSTSDTLKVRVGPADITFSRDQVESVTRGTPGENTLIEAGAYFENRKAADGIVAMARALDQSVSPQKAAVVILGSGDLLAESASSLDENARASLSRILAALAAVPAGLSEDLLARRLHLHLCLGESDQAETLFKQLGPEYFSKHPQMRKQLADWLQKSVKSWADAGDFVTASQTLKDLERVDPGAAQGQSIQFFMQWAAHERDGGNFEQALQIYTQNVMDRSPQIAKDRIATILADAERKYRGTSQMDRVAVLYESFGLTTIPDVARERLSQIWHDVGWQHIWHREFEPARAAFAKQNQYKKGSATQDLLQCDYHQRRADLKRDDYAGHFALGKWCMEKKLPDAALEEFRVAEKAPAFAPKARSYKDQMLKQLAEAKLMQIMDRYDAGEYAQVLKDVREFVQGDHPRAFLAQAKEIEDMTMESMRVHGAERPMQAESIFLQAQRAFYQGRYEKAEQLLKAILEHYQDATRVYGRANTFYGLVREKLALARLEEGQAAARQAVQPKIENAPTTRTRIVNGPTSGTSTVVNNEIDGLVKSLSQTEDRKETNH